MPGDFGESWQPRNGEVQCLNGFPPRIGVAMRDHVRLSPLRILRAQSRARNSSWDPGWLAEGGKVGTPHLFFGGFGRKIEDESWFT